MAVLREQRVNSYVEMAYALTEARFEAFDMHMTDLQSGRAKLADITPGAQDWPRFTTNQSERYEVRLSMMGVLESAFFASRLTAN